MSGYLIWVILGLIVAGRFWVTTHTVDGDLTP